MYKIALRNLKVNFTKRTKARALIILLFIILFPAIISSSLALPEDDLNIKGVISYDIRIDPITLVQEKKLVYTIYIDSQKPTVKLIKLILFDIDPQSIEISEGAKITNIITYNNLTIVELNATIPSGNSTIELEAIPKSCPIEVSAKLLVNSKPPKVDYFKNYKFLNLSIGDILIWNITITNREMKSSYKSSLSLPFLLSITLDRNFLEVISTNPSPNSTSEDGTYSWSMLLDNSSNFEISARIKNFSDWGSISLSPITLSFSSAQFSYLRKTLNSIKGNLESYLDFLNSSYNSGKSSLEQLSNFLDKLKLLSEFLEFEGNALRSLGNNLTSNARNLDSAISQIDSFSSSLNKVTSIVNNPEINYYLSNLPIFIQEAKRELQTINQSQASDIEQLMKLNQTLTYVYYLTSNESLKQDIQNSIYIVNTLLQNAKNRQKFVTDVLQLISKIEPSTVINTFNNLKNQINSLSSTLASMRNNVVLLKNGLIFVGDSLIKLGEANINQSIVLKNATTLIENQINSTKSNLDELKNKIEETKSSLNKIKDKITSIDNKQLELNYVSPEIVTERYIIVLKGRGSIVQQNITNAFNKSSIFLQYLIVSSNNQNVIPIFKYINNSNNPICDIENNSLRVYLNESSYIVAIARTGEISSLEERYFANILQYDIVRSSSLYTSSPTIPQIKKSSSINYLFYTSISVLILLGLVISSRTKSMMAKKRREKYLNELLNKRIKKNI